jgi:hypothetical protein
VLKNVTVTLPEEVARWARRKAADEDLSVSRLVAKMLEREMAESDRYAAAFEEWKKLKPFDMDADHRLSREDAHARR